MDEPCLFASRIARKKTLFRKYGMCSFLLWKLHLVCASRRVSRSVVFIQHDRHIEDERLRVYALLAGLMIWPSSEKTINCCADLDWKRALALHLW